jgi:acetyl-CoA carboxylase biotin carboxyl carrier protein
MDFKEIQELVKMFSKSGIGELKIEQENFSIKLKSNESFQSSVASNVYSTPMSMPPMVQSTPQAPAINPADTQADSVPAKPQGGTQTTIKAPMIGTFYRSSGPDKDPFVKVGDKIEVGQVICVIEAMKLFNEIESEVSGTIAKVLVNDASPIEYDQPLFVLE